jgi:hypothetical protein
MKNNKIIYEKSKFYPWMVSEYGTKKPVTLGEIKISHKEDQNGKKYFYSKLPLPESAKVIIPVSYREDDKDIKKKFVLAHHHVSS